MKLIATLLLLILSPILFAQQLDSLGIDNNSVLNTQELKVVNNLLSQTTNTLSLQNKKLAFVTGSSRKRNNK